MPRGGREVDGAGAGRGPRRHGDHGHGAAAAGAAQLVGERGVADHVERGQLDRAGAGGGRRVAGGEVGAELGLGADDAAVIGRLAEEGHRRRRAAIARVVGLGLVLGLEEMNGELPPHPVAVLRGRRDDAGNHLDTCRVAPEWPEAHRGPRHCGPSRPGRANSSRTVATKFAVSGRKSRNGRGAPPQLPRRHPTTNGSRSISLTRAATPGASAAIRAASRPSDARSLFEWSAHTTVTPAAAAASASWWGSSPVR